MPYFGYQDSKGLKLMKSIDDIINVLNKKILILDGALGTMIQSEELKEKDFRAERFNNHQVNLFGNNDILNLTKPKLCLLYTSPSPRDRQKWGVAGGGG